MQRLKMIYIPYLPTSTRTSLRLVCMCLLQRGVLFAIYFKPIRVFTDVKGGKMERSPTNGAQIVHSAYAPI